MKRPRERERYKILKEEPNSVIANNPLDCKTFGGVRLTWVRLHERVGAADFIIIIFHPIKPTGRRET